MKNITVSNTVYFQILRLKEQYELKTESSAISLAIRQMKLLGRA